jgi:hypothetical protein
MAKSPKKDDEDQSEAFKKAARDLGIDESEGAFDNVLKKITKAPPPKTVQKRKSKKRSRKAP